jgi:transcriptional regulator with XRE-family HTH domain
MRVGKPDGHVTGQEQEALAAGFGARLRDLREAAGLTRARLATLAGVPEMTVDFLEHGQRRPGKTTVAAMAAILSPQNAEEVAEELTALAPAGSYGTDLARADAGALGQFSGSDIGNGFASRRAHAHVGPSSHPNRSETQSEDARNAHGVHSPRAHAPVGSRLDGNTDTRGLVSDEERVRLQPFGSNVRTLRKEAGLTQEQLGKLAGIGTTHISRLEQGRRRPSVDAIQALARVLARDGTTEAVEQRLARLAGDSLRTGAARRKRQRNNKHRLAALREMERANRKLKGVTGRIGGRDLSRLLEAMEQQTSIVRAETQQEPARIRGIVTMDDLGRRRRNGYGRPRSLSMKDIEAWCDSVVSEPFGDDGEE